MKKKTRKPLPEICLREHTALGVARRARAAKEKEELAASKAAVKVTPSFSVKAAPSVSAKVAPNDAVEVEDRKVPCRAAVAISIVTVIAVISWLTYSFLIAA